MHIFWGNISAIAAQTHIYRYILKKNQTKQHKKTQQNTKETKKIKIFKKKKAHSLRRSCSTTASAATQHSVLVSTVPSCSGQNFASPTLLISAKPVSPLLSYNKLIAKAWSLNLRSAQTNKHLLWHSRAAQSERNKQIKERKWVSSGSTRAFLALLRASRDYKELIHAQT